MKGTGTESQKTGINPQHDSVGGWTVGEHSENWLNLLKLILFNESKHSFASEVYLLWFFYYKLTHTVCDKLNKKYS